MNWYKIAQIKLKNMTPSTDVYKAVEEIKALGQQNPLNPRETVVNDVKIEISHYDDKTIWLKSISSLFPRKGNGTIVLNKIIDIANRHNVSIYLDPMPVGGSNGISSKDLVKWYTNNKFTKGKDDFSSGLIHYPLNEDNRSPKDTE
jgi:hypothetical protein